MNDKITNPELVLQVDMLVADLENFAQLANNCAVPAGEITAYFKPYGNHQVLRIEIDKQHTAHLETMMALSTTWSANTVAWQDRDPLMRK